MLEIFAAIYLLVPILIFMIGWLKPAVALLTIVMLFYSFYIFLCNIQPGTSISSRIEKRKYTGIIVLIVVVWVLFSGVGGLVWQNRWDHKFRNALFNDLVSNSWPVINGDAGLCYYIGFWMPAAVVGKLFGIEAGYGFQLVWACCGVLLSVFLFFKYLGKQKVALVFLFIFFSGLDVFLYVGGGILERRGFYSILVALLNGQHIELMARFFNSSSNTTLLFWLYNQIIPFWVGFLTILTQSKNKAIFLIYVAMFFCCPFPCISLCPVIIYIYMKNQVFIHKDKPTVLFAAKTVFSLENLALIPVGLIFLMYYSSNIAVTNIRVLPLNITTLVFFLAYFVVEYGVYLVAVYYENKHDTVLNILVLTTIICSFVVMGNSYDFAWRTCIPLSFYLMVLTAKKLINTSRKTIISGYLTVILLLGAVTPVTELLRSLQMEYHVLTGTESARSDSLTTVFTKENNECYDNFIGDIDSVFFGYLCNQK